MLLLLAAALLPQVLGAVFHLPGDVATIDLHKHTNHTVVAIQANDGNLTLPAATVVASDFTGTADGGASLAELLDLYSNLSVAVGAQGQAAAALDDDIAAIEAEIQALIPPPPAAPPPPPRGTQLAKLTPLDGAKDDWFGWSVAISDGIVVGGAIGYDSWAGSAYVFDLSTGTQLAKLTPLDGGAAGRFGCSVAISDGIIVVGSPEDDDNGSKSGSAYVFNTSGTQLAKLLPLDGAIDDEFGISVAISGDTVVVGSYWDTDNGVRSGSAYVFDRSGTQLAKLVASDKSANDKFGRSVAISGSTIVVGAYFKVVGGDMASGSAYVFNTSGTQLAKLLPLDGGAFHWFGMSVAISESDGVIVVGASGDTAGSAYIFNATSGTQLAKLTALDGADDDYFGQTVAISGGTVVVGAHGHDVDGWSQLGAAYIFNTSGTQLAKLAPSDSALQLDHFGYSVAISDGTVVVGMYGDDDNGSSSGSVYTFAA